MTKINSGKGHLGGSKGVFSAGFAWWAARPESRQPVLEWLEKQPLDVFNVTTTGLLGTPSKMNLGTRHLDDVGIMKIAEVFQAMASQEISKAMLLSAAAEWGKDSKEENLVEAMKFLMELYVNFAGEVIRSSPEFERFNGELHRAEKEHREARAVMDT